MMTIMAIITISMDMMKASNIMTMEIHIKNKLPLEKVQAILNKTNNTGLK